GVQALQLDSPADTDDVPLGQTLIDTADARRSSGVGQYAGAGCADQPSVAARMVEVLVGIEDLRNLPTPGACSIQAAPPLQRVHGQGLTRLGTRDQIVKIAVAVGGPDSLDQHNGSPAFSYRRSFPATYP